MFKVNILPSESESSVENEEDLYGEMEDNMTMKKAAKRN